MVRTVFGVDGEGGGGNEDSAVVPVFIKPCSGGGFGNMATAVVKLTGTYPIGGFAISGLVPKFVMSSLGFVKYNPSTKKYMWYKDGTLNEMSGGTSVDGVYLTCYY